MSGLALQRDGAVTRLALDRPEKANALDAALVDALLDAVERAAIDGTRLLVVTGNGRNFSAGFDFSGFEGASEGDLLLRFVRIEQLLQAIHHAPFLTLACAHGRNFGAGVDLFAACAVRLAAPGATFRMPGLRFGVQLGTRRLAQRVGVDRARQLLADTPTFDAAEAQAAGLVNTLAPEAEWPEFVAREARRAEALAPESLARLLAATVADTRAADMADLVASLAAPGLKDRIRAFRSASASLQPSIEDRVPTIPLE